jgi:PAS domain S-box-containing protein
MSKDCVRVLLVEDSPSDAQLLCESLENYSLQKFEINRAERLDEAIALLAQRPFDVILQDLNLPDSNGMETCKRMSRAAGQVPIIVLTGADDETVAAEAMCVGIQDYLVKGQTHGGVIGRTIRYAVERSQSQQALHQANERLQQQAEKLQTQAEELQAQAEELTTANEELQESEQALHESEERLHLAMESGKVGVWEREVGTEHIEWSQGIYTLLGYKPGEVTPTREALRQRIHPQDLAHQDQTLRESMEQCEDYSCEFRVVWTDGSVHWVEARGQYVYAEDEGSVTLRMRGTLSDIDRRKQAEEALRESEGRHRRLIENLKGSHFIYVHDTKGVFRYAG